MNSREITFSFKPAFDAAIRIGSAILAVTAIGAIAHCSAGCLPAQAPNSLEQAYTTEIVACAATAGYPGAYDQAADERCRAEVNKRYGL